MRIALLVPTLEIGGVERVFANLANGLRDSGAEVDLVVGQSGGAITAALEKEICVFNLRSKRMMSSIPRLSSYLKRRKPQAVIAAMTHCTAAAVAARAVSRTRPVVIATEHNTMSRVVANAKGFKYRLMPRWSRLALESADAIVAVSAGVADDLSEQTGIVREKIRVIYNPVIASELFSAVASDFRHPWLQAGEPPVILGVGRLDKQKDFSTLVRAFSLLARHRNSRLMILGEGPDRSEIEKTVTGLGLTELVALPGAVVNPYPFMSRAAVFALSSQWEGFGVVLVEALALGLPVVSTNCPHGPAEILGGGRYGTLVPVGNYEKMADALLLALNNPIRQDASSHLEQFGVRNAAMQYLAAIASVHAEALCSVHS